MPELFPYLLFLHILGAMVAFGPTFAYPLIGAMGGREPMHANFATRVSLGISQRMVIPLAVVQGITGLLLVWSGGFDILATPWLLAGIALYLVALGFSILVQLGNVRRVIELTTMPSGGAPAGGPGAAGEAGEAAARPPAGPPPGLPDAVRRVQQGGALTGILIVVIVALMVVRPGT